MEIFVNKPIAYTISFPTFSYFLNLVSIPFFLMYNSSICVSFIHTACEHAMQNYCKVKSHILQKSQVFMTYMKMTLEKWLKTYTDP